MLRINKNTLGGYERGERLPDIVFLTRFAAMMGEPLKNLVDALVQDARDAAENEKEVQAVDAFFSASTSYTYSQQKNAVMDKRHTADTGGLLSTLLVLEPGQDHRERAGQAATEVIDIPIYDCSGSCGPGNMLDNARVIDQLPVALKWLQREGLHPDKTIIIGSKGDSMAPKIPPGSQLILDLTKREPSLGGVFAFCYQDELFIKYLQRAEAGLWVSSEQRDLHPPRLFSPEEAAEIRIEGRVHLVFSRV